MIHNRWHPDIPMVAWVKLDDDFIVQTYDWTGGFLTDHFPEAQKSIWDISGLYTHSRHVPGVNFAGLIHPGLIVCLPDQKLLDTWNKREADFIATNPTRVPACRTRRAVRLPGGRMAPRASLAPGRG
jgi:acetamidase/formamidase